MAELIAKGHSSLTEEFRLNRFKEGQFIDESVAAGVAH
jgi:sarcosine oxidase subunit beta